MTGQKGQRIEYKNILQASDVLLLLPFGVFEDFNLPNNEPAINTLFTDTDFAHLPNDRKEQAKTRWGQLADIFAESLQDFILAKA